MTDEEIMQLADEADNGDEESMFIETENWILRFARLVANRIRDDDAEIVDRQDVDPAFKGRIAAAIRARKT